MIYNDVCFEPVSVRNGNTNTNIPLWKKNHNKNEKNRFSGETTIKEY